MKKYKFKEGLYVVGSLLAATIIHSLTGFEYGSYILGFGSVVAIAFGLLTVFGGDRISHHINQFNNRNTIARKESQKYRGRLFSDTPRSFARKILSCFVACFAFVIIGLLYLEDIINSQSGTILLLVVAFLGVWLGMRNMLKKFIPHDTHRILIIFIIFLSLVTTVTIGYSLYSNDLATTNPDELGFWQGVQFGLLFLIPIVLGLISIEFLRRRRKSR